MVMEARRTESTSGQVRTDVPWSRVDLDLYEITRDGYTVGYIEVVGPVFVALGGPRYAKAVEVEQTLTFHAAVEAVLAWR